MAGNIRIIEPKENFQKVSKEIIFCEDVDVVTLGIYVKVLCLGKKWQLNIQGLAKKLGISTDKIRQSFAILERTGYLVRKRVQGEHGRFTGWDYEICSAPFTDIAKIPTSEKTDIGENRTSESTDIGKNRHSENRGDIDRDNNRNKDSIKKNRDSEFIPPTPQDVVAYCKEQGFADPEGFADYYLRCQKEMQWRTKSGKQITNWKLNIQQWRKYHQNDRFPRKGPASLHQTTKHSFQDFIER